MAIARPQPRGRCGGGGGQATNLNFSRQPILKTSQEENAYTHAYRDRLVEELGNDDPHSPPRSRMLPF